ncbi:MAG TPA: asparagine synthase-related protein [Candidatus Dormibacteraeota bacterium]|nr:asparagine synthase-related protein [Candidatus Dormibacteraeota bacterium]
MSGFAGVVSSDGAPVDAGLLGRMAEQLAFRGPDASAVRILDGAGFCFTLMRTGPAPQEEVQPLSLDGRQWLIGDIRLDGREDLRKALSQAGQETPATMATDEELTLRAWQLRGAESGELLMGDYAFAVWEPGVRRLVCVRDVIGVRPFFYGQVGNTLCFSNTLEVLRMVPGMDLRVDAHFVGDFLLEGWCLDPERTVHRGIRRLKAGHLVQFENGVAATRRFAELPMRAPLTYRRAEDYVEQFQSLLQAAVRERMPRAPAAFFMSGGLDSTSVAATAAQTAEGAGAKGSFRAYTVDFRPILEDDEARFAIKAAGYIEMSIEIVRVGDERPFGCWTDNSLRWPEPLHEPFQSRHVQMCREVSGFARVSMSGDGGDDILSGTATPYARYLARDGQFLKLATAFTGFLWRQKRLPTMGTGLRARLRKWRTAEREEGSLPQWLQPEFARKLGLRERQKELRRGLRYTHAFHPGGYAALSQGYWAGVLEDEDAAWTGVPLERRAPFLDRRLVEFLLQVPPVPWCMDKELLREAMRGLLPEEVRTRPKTPLRQEPFAAQAERLKWSPLPLERNHPILDEFVDWKKLEATLQRVPGSQLWDELTPVSLHHWAKAVENDGVIL